MAEFDHDLAAELIQYGRELEKYETTLENVKKCIRDNSINRIRLGDQSTDSSMWYNIAREILKTAGVESPSFPKRD